MSLVPTSFGYFLSLDPQKKATRQRFETSYLLGGILQMISGGGYKEMIQEVALNYVNLKVVLMKI